MILHPHSFFTRHRHITTTTTAITNGEGGGSGCCTSFISSTEQSYYILPSPYQCAVKAGEMPWTMTPPLCDDVTMTVLRILANTGYSCPAAHIHVHVCTARSYRANWDIDIHHGVVQKYDRHINTVIWSILQLLATQGRPFRLIANEIMTGHSPKSSISVIVNLAQTLLSREWMERDFTGGHTSREYTPKIMYKVFHSQHSASSRIPGLLIFVLP